MSAHAFKLAMIQMRVDGGELQSNLDRAQQHIGDAAARGADIALLPECMDLGWTHPSSQRLAGAVPNGLACQRLMQAAKAHRIFVCAGLTERDGDKVYNAAVLIDDEGQLLIRHRKLNELDIGHAYYAQGDRLNVAHTRLGTLGLMICADGTAKHHTLARSLCYMGADVILSPSAWAVPAHYDQNAAPYGDTWREAYTPVAEEFSVSIVGVSNVGPISDGPWQGWKCIGCSLAIGPDGQELIQGPYGESAESIMYLDIQPVPRPARGTGWNQV